MSSTIKRAVSLYSYQEEYFLQKMSLEDCIAAAAATGATGIEIVGEQSVAGCPKIPSEAFIEQWFGWMDKYKVTPVAHDMFLDYTRKKDITGQTKKRLSLSKKTYFLPKPWDSKSFG